MLEAQTKAMYELVSLLHASGQQTEETERIVHKLAGRWGGRVTLLPGWQSSALVSETGSAATLVPVVPDGVAMNRVEAAGWVAQAATDGRISAAEMVDRLKSARALRLASDAAFALACAVGAAALALSFGAIHALTLLIVATSAACGAILRRWIGRMGGSAFLQVFVAALLAGLIGAIGVRLGASSDLRLIAVCPCMVMVPGPHLLNGTLDLLDRRLPLGAARLLFAGLTLAAITAGLLVGLTLLHVTLPPAPPGREVSLAIAVVAGGVAAACYTTFFSLPWRLVGWPVAAAMVVAATRWLVMTEMGVGVVTGAAIAGLVAGTLLTPVSRRRHIPFAGIGFAAVVSLMPGVFVFRMVAGVLLLQGADAASAWTLFEAVVMDGVTAVLVIAALTLGIVVPKHIYDAVATRRRQDVSA